MRGFLSLALAGIAVSAMAQSGAPADVPKDHWAYSAVDDLYRLGILYGYPDGTFKGSRLVSRNDLASILNLSYTDLRNQTDGLRHQLNGLGQGLTSPSLGQLALYRTQMDALRVDVAGLKVDRAEVQDLTKQFGDMSDQLKRMREDLAKLREKLDGVKVKG